MQLEISTYIRVKSFHLIATKQKKNSLFTCSYRSKTFLTSCVPYLQLDPLPIKFYSSYLEVNSGEEYKLRPPLPKKKIKKFRQTKEESNCKKTNPMVVMKLVVKVSSENRSNKQLFPTPEHMYTYKAMNSATNFVNEFQQNFSLFFFFFQLHKILL